MDRRKVLLIVAVLVAALGAGLVFVYAQGAEDRAAEGLEEVTVLVATQEIAPGESASDAANAGKIVETEVPGNQRLEGSTDNGELFAGEIALTTIYPGEQLVEQKFGTLEDIETVSLPIPEGKIAVTLQLDDPQRVAGFARPGSRVAVFATYGYTEEGQLVPPDEADLFVAEPLEGGETVDPDAEPGSSEIQLSPLPKSNVVAQNLIVLAVGAGAIEQPTDGEVSGEDTVATTNMTVSVNQDQAALLIALRDYDIPMTFALRTDSSNVDEDFELSLDPDAVDTGDAADDGAN